MIAETAKIDGAVSLGDNVEVGEYVLLGYGGGSETFIGDDSVIRSHTVVYEGNKIGRNFQTGHGVLIRENNVIGDNVSIGSHSDIEHDITMEDDVRIHSGVFVPEYTTLKKGCWLGPGVMLTNAKYPLSKDVKKRLKGPVIGEGSIIGANATILPDVKIGRNCLIGAGAVVTEDVPDDSVVVGVPAKVLRKRSDIEGYR